MRHSMRVRGVVAVAALVGGLLTVAGCGDGGTSAGGSDSRVDKGTATAEPSAAASPAGAGLPDGFPVDQVPLLHEKVVSGVKGTPGGAFAWSVVMTSPRAVDDLGKEVSADFASAGYTTDRATELGDVSIHQFSNQAYEVGVTVARTGEGITITYLVKHKH